MNGQRRLALLTSMFCAVACSSSPSLPAGPDDGGTTSDVGNAPSDETSSDASHDASHTDTATGDPIVAPADTWTWIDVPESKCASGTPTGFAVNLHPGSTKLMMYLEGGGSCSDGQGCWVEPNPEGHTSGYDATDFAKEKGIERRAITSRDTTLGSPFLDANLVWIPYCTGDYHSGTKMKTLDVPGGSPKDTYFWGGIDLDLFLARLVPTIPGISRVWLAGGSAGGVGAVINYEKVHDAFGVRTDVIDDSGTPLGVVTDATILATWGTMLPGGCGGCGSLEDVMRKVRTNYPDSRFALLSFRYDGVVSKGYGLALEDFTKALSTTLSDMSGDENFQSFIADNGIKQPQHVVQNHFDNPEMMLAVAAWLTKMVNDEPWSSTTYAFVK